MKRKYLILHILALLCLYAGPLGGESYKNSNAALFILLLLPSLIGAVIIRYFIPFIILAGLAWTALRNKSRAASTYQGAVRPVLALLYILSLSFPQDNYKKGFFDDFQDDWIANLVRYHNGYKPYRGDVQPDLSDTARKRRLDERYMEVQRAGNDTGILKNGVRYTLFKESIYAAPFWYTWHDVIQSRATPLKKIGIPLDSTTNGAQVRSERIGRLSFATGILRFKLRCLTKSENTCLCQDIQGREVWYYNYRIPLRFISSGLLLFELQYLLCFVFFWGILAAAVYRFLRGRMNNGSLSQ